jgi:hypothetical protein
MASWYPTWFSFRIIKTPVCIYCWNNSSDATEKNCNPRYAIDATAGLQFFSVCIYCDMCVTLDFRCHGLLCTLKPFLWSDAFKKFIVIRHGSYDLCLHGFHWTIMSYHCMVVIKSISFLQGTWHWNHSIKPTRPWLLCWQGSCGDYTIRKLIGKMKFRLL